jgi:hypothetical protein
VHERSDTANARSTRILISMVFVPTLVGCHTVALAKADHIVTDVGVIEPDVVRSPNNLTRKEICEDFIHDASFVVSVNGTTLCNGLGN